MPLRVTLYDLDLRDEVSCATLLRYLEETAIQASAHLGFGYEWYKARGQFWVIRTMRLERCCPARFQDELEVRTWVSSMTRVRADRNYLVRRVRDGCALLRATANWVYLDGKTMFPARIAPEIVELFKHSDPPALPPNRKGIRLPPPSRELKGTMHRQAQYYEADAARHTNNAVYVDWLEEGVRDTLIANGLRLPLEGNPGLWFCRHSLEYLNASRPGDHLVIATRLAGQGKTAGHWQQEIRRADSGELLMRAESVTVWVDERNRVIRWPARPGS